MRGRRVAAEGGGSLRSAVGGRQGGGAAGAGLGQAANCVQLIG